MPSCGNQGWRRRSGYSLVPVALLGGLGLGVSGCATTINLPGNRFDSPEVVDDAGFRAKAQLGYGGSTDIILTEDYTLRPPSPVAAPTHRVNTTRAEVGLGIFERLEMDLRLPGLLVLKYQIFGNPRRRAGAGNIPVAITLGGGLWQSESQANGFLSNTSHRVELNKSRFEAALISGYRFYPELLVYGGPYWSQTAYDGIYTNTAGGRNEFAGSIRAPGFNLGLELGASVLVFKIEASYQQVRTEQSTQRDAVYLGGALAIYL